MKSAELMIAEGEGLTIEFKEKYTPKIAQDIVAFANSKGGSLLLGVSDNGNIVGEKLTNVLKAQIIDLGRNCKPSIHLHIETTIKNVIEIRVEEGNDKPYTCSDGYYKRFDALTQKLTPAEVREFFKKNTSFSFESKFYNGATKEDLAIEKVNNFLKESKSEVSVNGKSIEFILENIKLIKDKKITNAALLMFAKDIGNFFLHCQIFLVAFKGDEGVHIYDKKYVRDDLLTQFNEALMFCKKHLNVRTELQNGKRNDLYEIPINALREAIANAIIHRDYSMTGTNIQIEIHSDRVVISNPGGLPEGFNIDKLGIKSVRRNEILADLFSRMDKAEGFGSGIKRIRKLIKDADCPEPKFESDMFFTVTFKRPEEHRNINKSIKKKTKKSVSVQESHKKIKKKITHDKHNSIEMILEELRSNPEITQELLAKKVKLSLDGVRYHIKNLQSQKIITRLGSRKKGSWKILK